MRLRVLVPFIMTSLLLAACNGQKQTTTSLTMGYTALRISLPIYVAQQKGYFADEGLDIRLERFDTAQPLMQSLVAGNIEVGGYSAFPVTFTAMARSNVPLLFMTAMLEDQKHRFSYFIVPADSPTTTTIASFKGKRIGIVPAVAYKVWLEELVKANGLKPADIEIVQIDPALQASALQSGQVAALLTNDPAATTIIQKGIGRLISNEVEIPKIFGEPFLFGSFHIRKDFAEKNPDITQKIARALDKAVVFINNHQSEAKGMMKNYLPEAQQPFTQFYPDALYQTSAATDPEQFQKSADKYLEIGLIDTPLTISDLVFKAQ